MLSTKTVYEKLVAKVNAIELRYQVLVDQSLKQKMNQTDKVLKKNDDVYKKIPNTGGLVKRTDYNTKRKEISNKISAITGLLTNSTLNTKALDIQTKIPDISNQATKTASIQKLQRLKIRYLILVIWSNILIYKNQN